MWARSHSLPIPGIDTQITDTCYINKPALDVRTAMLTVPQLHRKHQAAAAAGRPHRHPVTVSRQQFDVDRHASWMLLSTNQ